MEADIHFLLGRDHSFSFSAGKTFFIANTCSQKLGGAIVYLV